MSYKRGFEIYDEDGKTVIYTIKGNDEWTVDMAWNDMAYNPAYEKIKPGGTFITDIEQLKNIPMYKINNKYIKRMRDEGYEVIDQGVPFDKKDDSLFFEMEETEMKWR